MPFVHISLEDGFEQDSVIVRVDGRQIYEQHGVTTRTQISLADRIETDVDGPRATVEVAVPTRDLAGSRSIEPGKDQAVGVSIRDGAIRFQVWDEPYGHL